MKKNIFEEFYCHTDVRLPQEFVDLIVEAKKDAAGCLPVLIIKDSNGNKYHITSAKDREGQNKKISADMRFLSETFMEFLVSPRKYRK